MKGKLRRRLIALLLPAILVASAVVYLPGISGPYVFDDRLNILSNSYLQITSLEPKGLYHASFSVGSGPLLRPISMLSFAINHYFTGSFNDSTPLKLTNLGIHIINGLLIFWLMRLVFARAGRIGAIARASDSLQAMFRTDLLAGAVALLWMVHPINLTSVLYVVQRMTALSVLFTLLGLICYLLGRERTVAAKRDGLWLIGLGPVVFGTLGVLSKESAVLLPVFMLALELTLFAGEEPWRTWSRLSVRTRALTLTALLAVLAAGLLWAVSLALPGYGSRSFTVTERVFTEARVLFFYLSLLLVPRIDEFGLYHDDILISNSLFSPWTTLFSVLGIGALAALAVLGRRRLALLSLGIAWFLIGHLLESSFIALEIAHEHRNYLAGLGVPLVIVHLLHQGSVRLKHKKLWLLYPVIAVIFAGTTLLRAGQWSGYYTLASYEALHHPDSARAQAMMASAAYLAKDYEGALRASHQASVLKPDEPGYRMNEQIARVRLGVAPDSIQHAQIVELLSTKKPTPETEMTLQYVTSCVATVCSPLQGAVEEWLHAMLQNTSRSVDRSFYYYLLGRTLLAQGRTLDALNALEHSTQYDAKYLHPLFLLAAVFVELSQVENAELMLERIRTANARTPHPRHKETSQLATFIEDLKRGRVPVVTGNALRDRLAPAPDGAALSKD